MKSSSSISNNSINNDFISTLIKQLLSSKILILIITSLFTFLAVIYSDNQKPTYITDALIEIGGYQYMENGQYKLKLIRDRDSLIEDLEIAFNLQNSIQFPIIFRPQLSNLIHLKVKSYNSKEGLATGKRVLTFLLDRNKGVLKKLKSKDNALNLEIADVNNKMDFIRAQQKNINEAKINNIENSIVELKKKLAFDIERNIFRNNKNKLYIENNLSNLNIELPSIDFKIRELRKIIVQDTENLTLLSTSPDILIQMASRVPTLNSVIYGYKIKLIEFETEKSSIQNEISMLSDSLNNWVETDEYSVNSFDTIQEISLLEKELEVTKNTGIVNANSSSDYFFGEQSYYYELVERKKGLIQKKLLEEKELEQGSTSEFKFINSINTREVFKNNSLYGTLGLIFGFLFSILIVVVSESLKASRKN